MGNNEQVALIINAVNMIKSSVDSIDKRVARLDEKQDRIAESVTKTEVTLQLHTEDENNTNKRLIDIEKHIYILKVIPNALKFVLLLMTIVTTGYGAYMIISSVA